MDSFIIEMILPSKAGQVYSDWLNSEKHELFTGGEAINKAEVGFMHSAWDGYIWGEILELDEGKRILMSWTTSEFPEGAESRFYSKTSMISAKLPLSILIFLKIKTQIITKVGKNIILSQCLNIILNRLYLSIQVVFC